MAALDLRILLQRTAGELARLHDLGTAAQDAAGLLMATAAARAPLPDAALVGLQALDALAQHLAAL